MGKRCENMVKYFRELKKTPHIYSFFWGPSGMDKWKVLSQIKCSFYFYLVVFKRMTWSTSLGYIGNKKKRKRLRRTKIQNSATVNMLHSWRHRRFERENGWKLHDGCISSFLYIISPYSPSWLQKHANGCGCLQTGGPIITSRSNYLRPQKVDMQYTPQKAKKLKVTFMLISFFFFR